MDQTVYTLGMWRVKPGKEDEFVKAWKALAKAFIELPNPPGRGTLIRSTTDPQLFYSFGPWKRRDDVEAMRANERAQAAIQRVVSLCSEASPGTFTVVTEAPARSAE